MTLVSIAYDRLRQLNPISRVTLLNWTIGWREVYFDRCRLIHFASSPIFSQRSEIMRAKCSIAILLSGMHGYETSFGTLSIVQGSATLIGNYESCAIGLSIWVTGIEDRDKRFVSSRRFRDNFAPWVLPSARILVVVDVEGR